MKLIGLSCGRKNGNGEILLKEALMAAQAEGDIQTEIVRLLELEIRPCVGCESCTLSMMKGGDGLCRAHRGKDDIYFLRDKFAEADGMIIAAPVYCLTAPGHLKVMNERFLGFGPQFLMSVFESARVRPKIGATIAVGGTDWTHPALPLMNVPLFMLQYKVVDQLAVNWVARPGHVLLKDEEMARSRKLGQRVGSSMGKPAEALKYLGDEPGTCPCCHSDMMMIGKNRQVTCPICDITGEVTIENGEIAVRYTEEGIRKGRWSAEIMNSHFADIERQHRTFEARKSEASALGRKYRSFGAYSRPDRSAPPTVASQEGDGIDVTSDWMEAPEACATA